MIKFAPVSPEEHSVDPTTKKATLPRCPYCNKVVVFDNVLTEKRTTPSTGGKFEKIYYCPYCSKILAIVG